MQYVPVIFRAERSGEAKGEVTAVFPTLPGSPWNFAVYAHVGQHSSGTPGWYAQTRAAKPSEYASLLAELRGIYERDGGWKLIVRQRYTSEMRKERRRVEVGA